MIGFGELSAPIEVAGGSKNRPRNDGETPLRRLALPMARKGTSPGADDQRDHEDAAATSCGGCDAQVEHVRARLRRNGSPSL
jgi:hypothetical protein